MFNFVISFYQCLKWTDINTARVIHKFLINHWEYFTQWSKDLITKQNEKYNFLNYAQQLLLTNQRYNYLAVHLKVVQFKWKMRENKVVVNYFVFVALEPGTFTASWCISIFFYFHAGACGSWQDCLWFLL